jgi:hypothetical protein
MFQIQNGIKEIESYFQSVCAEAAHFFEAGGDMTMVFVVNQEKTTRWLHLPSYYLR